MNNNVKGCSRYCSLTGIRECCEEKSIFPPEVSVAMAYVPFQQWCEVYQADKALCQGTIFPSLDLPFMGGRQR